MLHDEADRLTREEALRLHIRGSAWFSGEETNKGTLKPGAFADIAVLSADDFSVEPDEIRGLESVLTIMDGNIVHGAGDFAVHAPELPPVSPDWSPARHYGGYDNSKPIPPHHKHTPIMAADGRVWETGCGL